MSQYRFANQPRRPFINRHEFRAFHIGQHGNGTQFGRGKFEKKAVKSSKSPDVVRLGRSSVPEGPSMLLKRAAVTTTLFVTSVLPVSACSLLQKDEHLSSQRTIEDGSGAAPERQSYATNYIWHNKVDSFDFTSPIGTFLRAYVESMHRMSMDGGRRALFPGTDEATEFDLTRMERAAVDNPVGPSRRRGATDLHVLAVDETDSEAEIFVCEDPSGVAEKDGDGKWEARGSEAFTRVQISRLVVDKIGSAPPANISGTAQTPSVPMFGDWQAIEYQHILSQDPLEESFISQCLSDIGKEETPRDIGGYVVPEPPVEAPSPEPGWPEGESI